VTRIVGGTAKGRRLAVPARGIRPTSDRAREALFNTLAGLVDVDDARVLDLFAGTGAVGLEALSRGAAHATFVESDRKVADILARNIAAVGLSGAELLRCPVESFLLGATTTAPYRIVYADPPYALDETSLTAVLDNLADPRWLEPDTVVVVERSARGAAPAWPSVIEPIKRKRYGEGVLWYGRRR
jgi:16S rRNA (guanine966-N2)-methyltransferase